MLSIAEISAMTPAATPALNRQDPKAAAAEFDAMLLELLLRQSGLFRSMGMEDGAEPALMGEMFLQNFARDLAAQMDLGFGSLLISQAAQLEGEGSK